MKIGSFLTIIQSACVAAAGMYKAPRRDTRGLKLTRHHPFKKMEGFNKGMCKSIKKSFKEKNDYRRVCGRISQYTGHVVKQFNTKTCAYYNTEEAGKHGGPNPDKSKRGMRLNHKGAWINRRNKTRARREIDSDTDSDDDDEAELLEDFDNACDGTETGFAAELCNEDFVYEEVWSDDDDDATADDTIDSLLRKKKKKGKKTKKVKLTNHEKSFRKGLVNLIKFCNAYLSECYHVRVGNNCVKRAKALWARSRPKMKGYKKSKKPVLKLKG